MNFEEFLQENVRDGMDKLKRDQRTADKIPMEIIGKGDWDDGVKAVARWIDQNNKTVKDALKHFGSTDEWSKMDLSDDEMDRKVDKLLKQ